MKLAILTCGMFAANLALAAAPETAKAEIAHLLTAVEQSDCKFNRNGSWHDAKKARQHLQKKFDYIEKKNLATTAEKFIELGGATSSSSGKPYQMKCGGAEPVSSSAWLSDALKQYRQKR